MAKGRRLKNRSLQMIDQRAELRRRYQDFSNLTKGSLFSSTGIIPVEPAQLNVMRFFVAVEKASPKEWKAVELTNEILHNLMFGYKIIVFDLNQAARYDQILELTHLMLFRRVTEQKTIYQIAALHLGGEEWRLAAMKIGSIFSTAANNKKKYYAAVEQINAKKWRVIELSEEFIMNIVDRHANSAGLMHFNDIINFELLLK